MNKFGICYCDFNSYEPKVKSLEVFDTYEEAFKQYVSKLNAHFATSWLIPMDLWLVYIDNDKIVQFEQFKTNTKCKIIDLKGIL